MNNIGIMGIDTSRVFSDRWDDLFAQMQEGSGSAALTHEAYRDTGFPMSFFRHNQDDRINMVYQMSHGWDATEVRPHIHCIPMAAANGDVVFECKHVWAKTNELIPANSQWTTSAVTASFVVADQYKHKIVSFPTVAASSASNMGSSAMLFYSVTRTGLGAGDTYTGSKDHGAAAANLGVIYFDCHARKDNAGTVSEF